MKAPQLVADGVKAMKDVVSVPVTVKHRIGIDKNEDYGFVRDFVGTVAQAGCGVFIVHARNAWLRGLSPKENREIPPLRYDMAYRLKQDFPSLNIVYVQDGYFKNDEEILVQLKEKLPRLLLVALGAPKQEELIQKARKILPDSLMIGVGGSFDVWSGQKQRAPQWFCDNNLEWFYRLYQEPWRWKRMLVLPQFLLRTLVARK
jgi:hypothetical protein